MKKVLILGLAAVFCLVAFGAVFVVADDGMKTIDQPAEKWPAKKLDKKTGAKKKPPVTFNHAKHGKDFGCVACHHTQDEAKMKDGSETAKSCFECHGPKAEDKQLDSYKMIHDKKIGRCAPCHAKAENKATAPQKCKVCHVK